MGLINWFKDKIIYRMEHDIALMAARMEGFELQIDQLKAQIASVRQRSYKQSEPQPDQSNNEPSSKDWDEIRTAFGGSIPIELVEKYKRSGVQ